MINENLQDMNLWHVSKSKITSLRKTPMFFALKKAHSLGWYNSALNDGADPNKPMSDGKPAIYHELTRKYDARLSVLKELVKKGAKVDEEVFEFAKSIPSTCEALMFLYSIINK